MKNRNVNGDLQVLECIDPRANSYNLLPELIETGTDNIYTLSSLITQSPCNHRGFLFLQSPSNSPKRRPIPGTINHLHRKF